MADDVDITTERQGILENFNIIQIRDKANAMPIGKPGECESCGEEFKRIVDGYCGRCRDLLRLP